MDEQGIMDREEGLQAKGAKAPKKPSQKEIEAHELTLIPYRDWCIHCQKGKARNSPHRKKEQSTSEEHEREVVTIVSMDYA